QDPVGRFMVQAGEAGTAVPEQADDDLEIAFRAFVESHQLADAQRTAQQALSAGRDAQIWEPRLAQVAEWNSNPQLALNHWLSYAQKSGDMQAWNRVLALSMQLNANTAQLAALKHM